MSAHILVAEDQADIRDLIALNLRHAGYAVTPVADGRAALDRQSEHGSDLLILDLMMPGLDGLEVCKALRAKGGATPILMLTAKSTELDRVLGLELGADDYLTKPFSMAELLARVKALLRRADMAAIPDVQPKQLESGDLVVDLAARRVTRAGEALRLKRREFDLLAYFMRHAGQVLTRDRLLRHVWGYEDFGDTRTVDVHVRWLRSKIER